MFICTCNSFMQSFDDIQRFLRYYDPNLGVPLPEKTYAEDCRIYTPDHPNGSFVNIMDKMDEFVPSHFFGWYFKVNVKPFYWCYCSMTILTTFS